MGRLLQIAIRESIAYRAELIVWLLTTNMPLIMLMFWRGVAADGAIGAYTATDFSRYFVAVLIVRLLTGAWVAWGMQMEIKSGRFNQRLMVPLHPVLAYAIENIAAYPLRLIFLTPIIAIFTLLPGPAVPAFNVGATAIAILSAWLINYLANAALAGYGLIWERSMALVNIWMVMYFALSGYMAPLDLFPPTLRTVAEWLPFRGMLDIPVAILTGRAQGLDVLRGLLFQWTWIAIFAGLCALTWRRGLKKWIALGG
jgi:ABC-2 type transport system permease protein